MTKTIIPMSAADHRLITQQLTLAYWLFAAMGLFVLGIGFALDSIFFGLAALGLLLIFGWYARRFLGQSIGVVLKNNVKIRLENALLSNKDAELRLAKLTNTRTGTQASDSWQYCFFIEGYKVDVGMKKFEQFNVGDRITIEFFEFPAGLKNACGLLSIKASV